MDGGKPVSRAQLRWGLLALVALVALAAWLVTREGGSSQPADSQFLSKSELREVAAGLGHPLYWAGPALNAEYQLVAADGGHQVLYLPAGEHSDAASTRALTVGSYPVADPVGAVRALARMPDSIVRRAAGGQLVVSSRGNPTSAYFASPDGGVEVEVYAPSPGRAMRLALTGRVRPAQ